MLDQPTTQREPPLAVALLPIMAAVSIIFLVTGATLPALPLHIHDRLGFGAFVVGLVAAAQFAASLVSRLWAGTFSDRQGPKVAVLAGLALAALAGLVYLASLLAIGSPVLSVTVLLFGRALMGGAESFVNPEELVVGRRLGRLSHDHLECGLERETPGRETHPG